MSNRTSDDVLRELAFLAALDNVQARVDTSVIAEMQDLSGAVVGEFYGATVEQPSSAAKPRLDLPAIVSHPAVIAPGSARHVGGPGGTAYAHVTDFQLMSVCLSAGDTDPWEEFVHRYKTLIAFSVMRVARRMGDVSHELVDDLVQDVFLKLCANNFQALKRLKLQHDQAMAPFLRVVAINVAQNYFRNVASEKRGAATEKVELHKDLPLDEASGPSAAIEREVLFHEIDRLLQAFSERDRRVFWLHYRSGLNAKEISQMRDVGLTVKGTQSLLLRMRRQIWDFLSSPISERKKGTES